MVREDAWRELLRRVGVLLPRLCGPRRPHNLAEFPDWFPAWLLPRLDTLSANLRARWTLPLAVALPDREEYVRRYLASAAYKSARPDFFAEHAPVSVSMPPVPDHTAGVEELAVAEVRAEQVRHAAAQIANRCHRVAFWLSYYRVCCDLPPADMFWVQGNCTNAVALIDARYQAAVAADQHRVFTAAEIAQLMGASHLAQNGTVAVYQWIHQGRVEVEERLGIG
ncbi:MAG: hypothetical protein ACKODX_08215 [Gemmata sp.]